MSVILCQSSYVSHLTSVILYQSASYVGHTSLELPGGVVHHRVFQQGSKYEEDADPGPDVDGLGVGHGGQGVLYAGLGGGHRQQGRHSQRHTGRHRLVVQPEGHPGHGDRHGAGHVHRHYEERQLAGEQELDSQAGVSS